jgi:hypothetical protein
MKLTSLFVLAITSFSVGQTIIGFNGAGKSVQFETDGDIWLDGKCFGGVDPLPGGNGVRFYGNSVIKDGNLYFSGEITENAVTFPGKAIFGDGSPAVSITEGGDLHLAGTCKNQTGCSFTQYEPDFWNDETQSYNNCYQYIGDQHSTVDNH